MADPKHPQTFHRRVQAADSRARKRGEAQGGRDGRVRPVEERRRQVGQVDRRHGIAACRRQPHARAEPGDRAGAREPQAAHGGRRFKTSGADIRTKATAMAANADRYPVSAQCEILGVARPAYYSMRSRWAAPGGARPRRACRAGGARGQLRALRGPQD